MDYILYKGNRLKTSGKVNKTVTIFFMSFIYPANTGYLKRMDLLIKWANERFSCINFVIPKREGISENTINTHLKYCDNLFLLNAPELSYSTKLIPLKRLIYKLITGRYPKFHSPLFLNKSLALSFKAVLKDNPTEYFINTRNNFGGLIHFLPGGIKTIFDTQDIFTDMHRKYGMNGRSAFMQKFLIGYQENGDFVKSEKEVLESYDKIIAISETDFQKYIKVPSIKNKIYKIESIGIMPKEKASAGYPNKEFDALIVASNFKGAQDGIDWFINHVANFFKMPISLCIVGSIGDYYISNNLNHPNIKSKVTGFVDSLDEYYEKSKVVTLCMLEGTGTSVKGIEALSYGAAIVSTTAGVRFGRVISGEQCIITDDARQFAESVEELIKDDKLRKELGENSLKFANENFSLSSTYNHLDNVSNF
jgi:glycosyltransferase involved in cell wall biosynthesis